LLSIFDKNKNKILKNILNDIYAGNILEEIFLDKDSPLNQININREVNDIKKEERKIIAKVLKSLTVNVESLMGFDKAIIADGGVNVEEVDFENMSLKKILNLHVTGDMLNISRPSGGYSLQLCWTTGYVAGCN
jgi:predicted flavoprotein YhiN